MDPRMTTDLLKRLGDCERQSVRFRRGEVTDDSPLTVDLGASGASSGEVRRLASYTPTIGDQVAVLVFDHDLLVLGEIA